MFENLIALAEELAARTERSVGKRFEDVPPSDLVSRTETEYLYDASERRIAEVFGPDSEQMTCWKTSLEAERQVVFELYPDDEFERWLHRLRRVVALLRTLEQQSP